MVLGSRLALRAMFLLVLATACKKRTPAPPVAPTVAEDDASRPIVQCATDSKSASGASMKTRQGRTMHVFAPASDRTHPLPVVVVFHGWYSNGRDFAKWFEMEKHVERSAIVVYPDSDGPTWDVHGATDLDFVADLLDVLGASYCIDPRRVLAFGFSYGGKMAHHLACKRPDLIKAVAVGDGSWADPKPTCGAAMPVLVTHRTRDHDELIAWGKNAADRWAAVDACAAETEPSELEHGCVKRRGCKPGSSVTFCEDTHFDPTWKKDWNHTVREEYRALTWRWFRAL